MARLLTPPEPAVEDPDLAEARIRQAFAAGDVDALRGLAEPWMGLMYTHCLHMLGSPSDAEDAAQDALLRALERHHQYDPNRPFRPWLLTIASNICRDRRRTVWWKRVSPLTEAATRSHIIDEDIVEAADQDRQVRQALMTLAPNYRQAVSLFHLEDLTYAEISEITGVKVPALKQRVRRGLQMLEVAMRRQYPNLVLARSHKQVPS